jgi:PPOX class probable FMN-dependent enzyme
MRVIDDIAELEALYEAPVPTALTKVARHLTPLYRQWIEAARFCVLATVGPDGTDATPRGDDGPVVRIVDDRTLWLPDWRGNNRLDALRNIVRDGRVSMMFMVPGCNNVVRLNGRAVLTADGEITGSFERDGKTPRTVVVATIEEVYFQCAKALMRAGLWSRLDRPVDVPTAGQFLRERDASFDDEDYDRNYPDRAAGRMW